MFFYSVNGWNVKCNVYCLTKHSLHIYLVHVFLLEFFDRIYKATFCTSYLWSKYTASWFKIIYMKINMTVEKVFKQEKRNNKKT